MNRYIRRWIVPLMGFRIQDYSEGVLADNAIPYALATPWLLANFLGPLKHPGVKPQRNSSMVTVQSALHGVPYLEAVQNEQDRLAPMELGRNGA